METKLGAIAGIVGGKISGDAEKRITGAAPFEYASGDDITYAASPKYLRKIAETNAGAVIAPINFQTGSKNLVCVENPPAAFAKILDHLYPPTKASWFGEPGVSEKAHIGRYVKIGRDAEIAPFVVIGEGASIGDRVRIHPNTVIGDHASIGDDTEIFPNVTIAGSCMIGKRVAIHAGTVIGSDGFGYAPDGEKYHKIRHMGIVEIGDDVEIGSGNTIDRATFGKTVISCGVKTDNLVHIAHNVTIGENSVIVAQVGIAGSTTVGRHAVIAGQVGVSGHISIGDNVTVGPCSGVARSIPDGETVSGAPEMPHRLWLRVQRLIPKLPELAKRISEIEKRLKMK